MLEAYEIGITLALQDGVSAGITLIRRDLDALDRAIAATSQNLSRLQAQSGIAAPTRASLPSPPKPPSVSVQPASDPGPPTKPAVPMAVELGPTSPAMRTAPHDMAVHLEPAAMFNTAAPIAWPSAPAAPRPAPAEAQIPPRTPVPTVTDAPQAPRNVAASVGLVTASPTAPPPERGPALQPAPPLPSAPSLAPQMRASPPTRALPATPATPIMTPASAADTSHRAVVPPATQPAPRSVTSSRVEPAALPHLPRPHHSGHAHHTVNHPAITAKPVLIRAGSVAPPGVPLPALAARPSANNQAQPNVAIHPVATTTFPPPPEIGHPFQQSGPASSSAPPPSAPPNITLQGDIILDGARVGRWMTSTLARQAARPPAGPTGPDPRQTPLWSGQAQGF